VAAIEERHEAVQRRIEELEEIEIQIAGDEASSTRATTGREWAA